MGFLLFVLGWFIPADADERIGSPKRSGHGQHGGAAGGAGRPLTEPKAASLRIR
tara:strand:- start:5932 stop:6093 length:162 start_codon:yes stop_codon:yes gene_type:complete